MYKENKKNIAGHQAFVNAWREISANADKLFIAPYFSIPFDDIGVFESPFRYPLPNVVFKNSLTHHAHEKACARFGIQSAADLYRSDKVRFVGPTVPLIQQYYRLQTGQSISVVTPPEKYRYLMVTQLSLTQGYR